MREARTTGKTEGEAMQPTANDIRRAYHASRLWVLGVTLQKAVTDPLLRKGLETTAKGLARPHHPQQLRLI
jgi:hypothetical protein